MDRRTFLKGSASVAALLVAPSIAQPSEWANTETYMFKAKPTNSGPVTLSLNGGPPMPVFCADGSPFPGRDLRPGQTVELYY